jgi:hypothetical protein
MQSLQSSAANPVDYEGCSDRDALHLKRHEAVYLFLLLSSLSSSPCDSIPATRRSILLENCGLYTELRSDVGMLGVDVMTSC